jgi:sugar phosphate isomerase/epimerase
MHIGICMSAIDHRRYTRSEAREFALQLKERFDLTSIELVLEGIGRRYAPYPWEFEEAELRELEDFLGHFQHTGAHLPFYDMNVIAVNEKMREEAMDQLRIAIDIAKRLKLDYAVVHATGTTYGLATDRESHRFSLAFRRLAGFCKESSVKLSIENASYLHDIESCVKMIDSLKDEGLPVAMTFDTGHANIPQSAREVPYKRYGSMADALERCVHVINNIHLHNNHGATDQHLSLLDGNIQLESCIKRLRDLNYTGSISIEVGAGVEDIEKEIATLKEWCEA